MRSKLMEQGEHKFAGRIYPALIYSNFKLSQISAGFNSGI